MPDRNGKIFYTSIASLSHINKNAGLPIHVPENYYPDDDDTKPPMVTWRSHANLLYQNWLNYFVYQTTPYDLSAIRPV